MNKIFLEKVGGLPEDKFSIEQLSKITGIPFRVLEEEEEDGNTYEGIIKFIMDTATRDKYKRWSKRKEINNTDFKNLDLLKKVRLRAKTLRDKIKGKILLSWKPNKKFVIITSSGNKKPIHFGSSKMSDFLSHSDEKRKENFHSRFKNNKGYDNPNSGLYYSRHLLW